MTLFIIKTLDILATNFLNFFLSLRNFNQTTMNSSSTLFIIIMNIKSSYLLGQKTHSYKKKPSLHTFFRTTNHLLATKQCTVNGHLQQHKTMVCSALNLKTHCNWSELIIILTHFFS